MSTKRFCDFKTRRISTLLTYSARSNSIKERNASYGNKSLVLENFMFIRQLLLVASIQEEGIGSDKELWGFSRHASSFISLKIS